jgi:hypothetical protein
MVKSNYTIMKKKIILDTDIGSDIDDAVCLVYLLVNPWHFFDHFFLFSLIR